MVETQLLESVLSGNSAVVAQGIYFILNSKPRSAQFLSFCTGKVVSIADIPREPGRSFSVSPDGHWLLYTAFEPSGSDLMRMEAFRWSGLGRGHISHFWWISSLREGTKTFRRVVRHPAHGSGRCAEIEVRADPGRRLASGAGGLAIAERCRDYGCRRCGHHHGVHTNLSSLSFQSALRKPERRPWSHRSVNPWAAVD